MFVNDHGGVLFKNSHCDFKSYLRGEGFQLKKQKNRHQLLSQLMPDTHLTDRKLPFKVFPTNYFIKCHDPSQIQRCAHLF